MGFDVKGLDEFEKYLDKIQDVSSLCEEVVSEMAPKVVKKMKSYAPVDTGDLRDSIKATKPTHNEYGCFSVVRPTGVDDKGVRNIEKAIYNEYGTSKMSGTGFIRKTSQQSRKELYKLADEKFKKHIKN